MEYLEIGKTLKELRNERGVSQKEAAEGCNITQGALSRYEKNQLPKTAELCQIADYYNVSFDYLLGRTKVQSIPTDGNMQAAAELTGLSESALQVLSSLKPEHADLVSELLSTMPIETLLDLISKYIQTSIPRFRHSTSTEEQIAEGFQQIIPLTIAGTSVMMQESSLVASVLHHEMIDSLDTIAYLKANGGHEHGEHQ